jgi:glycine/D-amino acid oxidase-like deaminating enzyme
MVQHTAHYDYLVIGGGFYGCCLALFLRTIANRVLLVEADECLMNRASRVNQARIHTGFHYPRSALTAVKSMVLHRRFAEDFPEAVVADFQMLYAVARRRSKVSSNRFFRMFRDIGAPIQPASATQAALFDSRTVDEVFACSEAAFDHSILRRQLSERLARAGVDVWLGTRVTALSESVEHVVAGLSAGHEISARFAFNVTYSQINAVLGFAGLPQATLKHELAEIALVEPPAELADKGVTLMDGPFFSCMPYPSAKLHSLTHVRYTPHESWTDDEAVVQMNDPFAVRDPESRVRHMILDACRFLPCLSAARYVRSIYEVKTVLQKNEHDDGRPILYQRRPAASRVVSILGAKIDNIYDLFDLVKKTGVEFAGASDALAMGREN